MQTWYGGRDETEIETNNDDDDDDANYDELSVIALDRFFQKTQSIGPQKGNVLWWKECKTKHDQASIKGRFEQCNVAVEEKTTRNWNYTPCEHVDVMFQHFPHLYTHSSDLFIRIEHTKQDYRRFKECSITLSIMDLFYVLP
uniref:Uncharacterized protein n=1 Tax=Romanomermis culicivorax TaxID=13658 RepID=A0A915IX90_ROMCU